MWRQASYRSKLGGFMPRVAADVHALAEASREQLLAREDVQKFKQIPWRGYGAQYPVDPAGTEVQPTALAQSVWPVLKTFLYRMPDEGYKMFPWIVREFKRQGINMFNWTHAMDILSQAIHWIVWSNEHNKPMPDMMAKVFTFATLEQWVYIMNHEQGEDTQGQWVDSHPVFDAGGNWHIVRVGPADLPQEGEIMGHCVGGYVHTVERGDTTIYSLRDPKGEPHVTIEVSGDEDLSKAFGEHDHTPDRKVQIIQIQGKQNREPIPEYRQKVDAWIEHLSDNGYEPIEEDPDREPEYEYEPHHDGPYEILDAEGLDNYHATMHDPYDRADAFGDDDEGVWEGNTITYRNPRNLVFPNHNGNQSLFPIAKTWVDALMRGGQADNEEITKFCQSLWLASMHKSVEENGGWHERGLEEFQVLVDQIDKHIREKLEEEKTPPAGQEQLFAPAQVGQKQAPQTVRTMLAYLYQLSTAPQNYAKPVMKWVYTEQPDGRTQGEYAPSGETRETQIYWPGWGNGEGFNPQEYFKGANLEGPKIWGTFASVDPLLVKLQRLAGHTTDWNFIPAEYDGEEPCPICGHELEIQLHRGVTCPQCGSKYEMGVGGVLLPSDDTIDESAAMWPDTLPWGEEGNEYYRNAHTAATSPEGEAAMHLLQTTGGFSLYGNGKQVQPGYYTSYEGHERQIPWATISASQIDRYMKDHQSVLKHDSFFGGWLDNSTQIVFLDVSARFTEEYQCMEFARKNKQKAIWDGYNMVEIPVPEEDLDPRHKQAAGWNSHAWEQSFPFIFHPETRDLRWGGPGEYHDPIFNDMVQHGEQTSREGGWLNGRWWPTQQNLQPEFYHPEDLEARHGRNPREVEKSIDMIRRNAPTPYNETPQMPLPADHDIPFDADDLDEPWFQGV